MNRCSVPVSTLHSSVFARLASGAFYETIVTPVETGVQAIYNYLKRLDSGFRRNDEKRHFQTFYEIIKIDGDDKYILIGSVQGLTRASKRFDQQLVLGGCERSHHPGFVTPPVWGASKPRAGIFALSGRPIIIDFVPRSVDALPP